VNQGAKRAVNFGAVMFELATGMTFAQLGARATNAAEARRCYDRAKLAYNYLLGLTLLDLQDDERAKLEYGVANLQKDLEALARRLS
jgi:hypothetical protein